MTLEIYQMFQVIIKRGVVWIRCKKDWVVMLILLINLWWQNF